MNGKGSSRRPTDQAKFDANYIEAFGEPCSVCGRKTKSHIRGEPLCASHFKKRAGTGTWPSDHRCLCVRCGKVTDGTAGDDFVCLGCWENGY